MYTVPFFEQRKVYSIFFKLLRKSAKCENHDFAQQRKSVSCQMWTNFRI